MGQNLSQMTRKTTTTTYTADYSQWIDKLCTPPTPREYSLVGIASCINMGMFDKKTVRAAVFEIEDTNIVCESMVGGRGMYEVCAQMTDTQCRYVVVRLKTMGLRRESLTVVLLWTPEHAMLAERVLYRKQLRGFCAQLRHVDHVVEMTDWSQFSRSWILARISESQKGA